MQPFNQGPGPGPQPQAPAGPTPGFGPIGPRPRTSFDLGRIASVAVVVAGVVVLFCSLLDLYSITVDPGKVDDSVNGTVEVGMGFYSVVPFNAPVVALAIPILMLVAAVTAIPGALGRRQGALVSAVSAISATLLALVLAVADPIPAVSLSGDIEQEASSDLADVGVESVDDLVDKVVNIGPGAGLIIALVFGFLGSAAAGIAYWRTGADESPKPFAPVGSPTGPFTPMAAPAPFAPAPFAPEPYVPTDQLPAHQGPGHQAPAPQAPVQGWAPAPPPQQPPTPPFESTQIAQIPPQQPPAGPAGTP